MKKIYFILFIVSLFLTVSVPAKSQSANVKSKTATTFDTIHLQMPDTLGGVPLLTAAQHRRSYREFDSKNLSAKHLSELLWMANGINRAGGKRTVPSAMALYPIQAYVFLADGVYFYNPQKHLLEPVMKGDFRVLCGTQEFVKTAPLNLIYIANYNVFKGRRETPAEEKLWLASLDAGHCSQNVYLYCASEGLKCVVRASADKAALLRLLQLNENYQFIVAQTIGY